jgi:hypothetical protein
MFPAVDHFSGRNFSGRTRQRNVMGKISNIQNDLTAGQRQHDDAAQQGGLL